MYKCRGGEETGQGGAKRGRPAKNASLAETRNFYSSIFWGFKDDVLTGVNRIVNKTVEKELDVPGSYLCYYIKVVT